MKQITANTFKLLPLMLVIFLDSLGNGLLFPLMAQIFSPSIHFFTLGYSASNELIHRYYALLIGSFGFSAFIGCIFLGGLSDVWGRKNTLLVCLLGSLFGYLVLTYGVMVHSIIAMLIGRVIAGLTAGCQSVARSCITALFETEPQRSQFLGMSLSAGTIGYIAGPLVGGMLITSWFTSHLAFAGPMLFICIITGLNLVLLWRSDVEKKTLKINEIDKSMLNAMSETLRTPKLIWPLLLFAGYMIGWAGYYSFIALYLKQALLASNATITIDMSLLGIGFLLGSAWCASRFSRHLSQQSACILSMLLAAVATLLHVIPGVFAVALGILLVGTGISISYTLLVAVISHYVPAHRQGGLMGLLDAIGCLCYGVSAFFLANVKGFQPLTPLKAFLVLMLLSAIFCRLLSTPHASKS